MATATTGSDVLRRVSLFQGLSSEELGELWALMLPQAFAAGEDVVEEGSAPDKLYVIVEGDATVLAGEMTLAELGPGDYFGEMSVIDGGFRAATVRAATLLQTLSVDAASFQDLLKRHWAITEKVLIELCRRVRAFDPSSAATRQEPTPDLDLRSFDMTDLDNFANGFPHEPFIVHRRTEPVYWHEPTEHTPQGEGFWSVAKHADVMNILRDPQTYSAVTGGDRPYGGTLLQDIPFAGELLNMMDDPRHKRIRRLVAKGFTPRAVSEMDELLQQRSAELVDGMAERGGGDFVLEVAQELPMLATCMLLGIPDEERHKVFEWVNPMVDFEKGEAFAQTPEFQRAQTEALNYGNELIAAKRRAPGDDMLSVVTHAALPDEEPSALTDGELVLFFLILFGAGYVTTRNSISGGLLALLERPDQMEMLRADPSLWATAADEVVRWVSPVTFNRRTATCDVELRGKEIKAGQKVVFWESSANRDEEMFRDPMIFDVRRHPNPHLGFGAGTHFCLGAKLALLEIRVVLADMLRRFKTIEVDGTATWARSNKHNGLRHLPLRVVPA
jgi:cytochrome P450